MNRAWRRLCSLNKITLPRLMLDTRNILNRIAICILSLENWSLLNLSLFKPDDDKDADDHHNTIDNHRNATLVPIRALGSIIEYQRPPDVKGDGWNQVSWTPWAALQVTFGTTYSWRSSCQSRWHVLRHHCASNRWPRRRVPHGSRDWHR